MTGTPIQASTKKPVPLPFWPLVLAMFGGTVALAFCLWFYVEASVEIVAPGVMVSLLYNIWALVKLNRLGVFGVPPSEDVVQRTHD